MTAPVSLPPVVVRVTVDPVGPAVAAVVMVSVACVLKKLKVFAEEVVDA